MKWTIGVGVTALIAIPAFALSSGTGDHASKGPETRADVEAKVKTQFAEMDTNKDGAITREEADAYKTTHRFEMRDAHFAKLDADKDGKLSQDEFKAPRDDMHEGKGHRGGHGMRHGMMSGGDLFKMADGNNDGKVTLAEATAKRLEMFDRADANKDGTVTPEERKAAWKSWF